MTRACPECGQTVTADTRAGLRRALDRHVVEKHGEE